MKNFSFRINIPKAAVAQKKRLLKYYGFKIGTKITSIPADGYVAGYGKFHITTSTTDTYHYRVLAETKFVLTVSQISILKTFITFSARSAATFKIMISTMLPFKGVLEIEAILSFKSVSFC